jgi:hypothetical protein
MTAYERGRRKATVLAIDPSTYRNHFTHGEERTWSETNCYVDLWIELLHGLGLDPVACMAFTVGIDFEGDQWTFFKVPLEDIREMYGLDTTELNVWRPARLVHHCLEQAAMGRPTIVEVDAHYLPDTAGTTYKTGHEKTSIAIVHVDLDAQRCGYFHAKSHYVIEGEDFRGAFRLNLPEGAVNLPPYVETVKMHCMVKRTPEQAGKIARALLSQHLSRKPPNPVTRFRGRFLEDLEWLKQEPLEVFHGYAFASLRQIGACYELTSTFLRWLQERGTPGLTSIAETFDGMAKTAKSLQFKTARVVHAKKAADLSPMIDALETSWDEAMKGLVAIGS